MTSAISKVHYFREVGVIWHKLLIMPTVVFTPFSSGRKDLTADQGSISVCLAGVTIQIFYLVVKNPSENICHFDSALKLRFCRVWDSFLSSFQGIGIWPSVSVEH